MKKISAICILFITIFSQVTKSQELVPTMDSACYQVIIYRDKKILDVYIHDTLWKSYPIAVGKSDSPTPLGEYKIINKIINPTWYPPKKEPVEPGIHNPLGTRWMGLSEKGYGIHGTNDPYSIGKPVSKGCIRMKKKDVEELFDNISVGTVIKIVENSNEPNDIESLFAIRKPVDSFSQFETEFKLIASHSQIRLY